MDNDTPELVLSEKGEPALALREDWWTEDGGRGILPRYLLAPDLSCFPFAGGCEEPEFYDDIGRKKAVVPIIITPFSMAPWVKAPEAFPDAFFVIVNGHQKCKRVPGTKAPKVSVMVRIYENEAEYNLNVKFLDSWCACRTLLEEGRAIVALLEQGVTPETIASMVPTLFVSVLYKRVALTRLPPEILVLIAPRKGKKCQLQLEIASMLGGLASPSVKDLLDLFPRTKRTADYICAMSGKDRISLLQIFLLKKIQEEGKQGHMNVQEAKNFLRDFTDQTCPTSGFGSQKHKRNEFWKSEVDVARPFSGEEPDIAESASEESAIKFPCELVYWQHLPPPGRFVLGTVDSPPHFMRLLREHRFPHQPKGRRKEKPAPPGFPDPEVVEEMM